MIRSLWRSLLFVPGDRDDWLQKAPGYYPDGIIIDLEDGVAAEKKSDALRTLSEKTAFLRDRHISSLVRIDPSFGREDFEKIARAHPDFIMLPKIKMAADILLFAEKIKTPPIDFIALIESPYALEKVFEIASLPCVKGLALGSEDFSLALQAPPSEAALDLPCKMIALAAAAHDISGFGLPISVGEFGDLAAYRRAAQKARAVGLCGALCIHPAQVKIVNEVFCPSEADRAFAQQIIDAWEKRENNSAIISVAGRMVDAPVVEHARRMLEKA